MGASVGVHDQAGAPASERRRPRCPPVVLAAHTRGRHRRQEGDRGGRQDHARSPTRPPTCWRLRTRRAEWSWGSGGVGQVQRDPRPEGPARPLDPGGAVVTADATAHPEGHRPVDPQPRRPLRAHREEQPTRPETGAQGPTLEGRPGHLERRHRSRRAGAAHRPDRRGPRAGRLPRRRPGGADQTHQNRQQAQRRQEEDHRGGPPGSAPLP